MRITRTDKTEAPVRDADVGRYSLHRQYAAARSTLCFAAVFTAIPIPLSAFGISNAFHVVSYLPRFFFNAGTLVTEEAGELAGLLVPLFLSLVLVLFLAVCFLLSAKRPSFLILALILYASDLAASFSLLISGNTAAFIVGFVFHFFIITRLAGGIKATRQMIFSDCTLESPEGAEVE